MTHYELLRVRQSATATEIRDAYRRAAREAHPDRHGDASAQRMAAINEAYRVLADPVARRRYDETLDVPRPRSSPAARVADPTPSPVYVVDTTPARFPWRFMAVLTVGGMGLIVIGLIFTKPSDPVPPDNILRGADCVVIGGDLAATEVDCDGAHDAVVQSLVPFGETCPSGTEGYRDRQGMGTACVVRVAPP